MLNEAEAGGASSTAHVAELMTDDTRGRDSNRTSISGGLPLPPGPLLAFVLKVIAIIVTAVVSYQTLRSSADVARQIRHTQEVTDHLVAVLSATKDAETGQRGYMLTAAERYLQPYTAGRLAYGSTIAELRALLSESPVQLQRLVTLQALVDDKFAEMTETVTLRRNGDEKAAMAIVDSDRGRVMMDRLRVLVAEMRTAEQALMDQRQADWEVSMRRAMVVAMGGSGLLFLLVMASSWMTSRDYLHRRREGWLRATLAALSTTLQGELRLQALGERLLDFLSQRLDAQVGAAYVANGAGQWQRMAAHALPADASAAAVRDGEGLVGQVARDGRVRHVTQVPAGYLPVASASGRGDPRELIVAPAQVDGEVQAVLELGFFRRLQPVELELLDRAAQAMGVAVRTSKDRTRLEELLDRTQRQGEELQAQQEELRVANEELEEKGRVLEESQAQLEAQQAELEQTNSQLEEQTQALVHQRDALAQAQGILADKANELARANQYKSEFLANMSHELRTPLNSTLILAKLLADNKTGNLTAEQVRFAQTISAAGHDLLALINDILDLSKIEAGKVDVALEWLDVSQVLDAQLQTLLPIAQDRGLSLLAQVDPAAPTRLRTDGQRLAQILKNLLSNALKFTEAGSVTMSVRPGAAGTVQFAVRDTGIGIPPHQHAVIFEAFRQADGSTHRKFGGTGLGLSISRDLARLLGGDITLASAPGEGSEFTLTLPVEADEDAVDAVRARSAPPALLPPAPPLVHAPAAAQASVPAAEVGSTELVAPARLLPTSPIGDDRDALRRGERLILVIEDDQRFAAILRDLVRERGFQCVAVHAAADGLTAAALYRPSAILLDMQLPDQSGLVVLDQLKRDTRTRHIPVHVVSVADYAHEALGRGAIGYALKPVTREKLVTALQRLEAKLSQDMRHVLVVEDDPHQREAIRQLLDTAVVRITDVASAGAALKALADTTFDCVVMDLHLPDLSGYELLQGMASQEAEHGRGVASFPPVIVYTGRSLSSEEEQRLRRFSRSIIVKDARSPERLLDEVSLFLHQVESDLPPESQRLLQKVRDRDDALVGRRVLVVEDDVRNIFALSSVLEPQGVKVEIARNGIEALKKLDAAAADADATIDLVLMDIMMPEMDGFTAMREIRQRPEWKRLPIIALTAKAMRDDHDACIAAGANDYIAKPLDVEKLVSLVRVWMPK